ncbi:hypothetical protein RYX41_00245 [Lactiplantibacillus plantarum]|nr:hypothetical protein [Lactiplantibacillus plantarum]
MAQSAGTTRAITAAYQGNWYQFQKTATRYQVFSEYVSGNVATEIDDQHTPFKLLARLQLTKPAVQVIYTGTAQTELQGREWIVRTHRCS